MAHPEMAESCSETIKRSRGFSAPLSSSVAPKTQEPASKRAEGIGQQGKEEGVNEGDHEEELEAVVPLPEARAFHGKFAFTEAVSQLDLPAAGIGEDDVPGIVSGVDGLIGEEVPGSVALAWAREDQPQGLRIVRMGHRQEE